MSRVVIDTEGVRALARYTQGAIDEVFRIRTELLRAQAVLDTGPGRDAFGPLLGALTDFCTVLTDDRRSLVSEALAVEAEEGLAPATSVPASVPDRPRLPGAGPSAMMIVFTPLAVRAPLAPAPEPWNSSWVTTGGVIPVGAATRSVNPASRPPDELDIGAQWETKADTDSDLGHNNSSAEGQFRLTAGSGSWESTDSSGNTIENWEAYQEMVASVAAQTSGNLGPVDYKFEGQASAGAVNDVHVWTKAGPDGAGAGGSADASVYVDASASAGLSNKDLGAADGHVVGEAAAQAHAEAGAEANNRGLKGGVGGEASADADVKAGYTGHAGPLKGGREVSVGLGTGVGGHASFSLSLDDIGFDLGGKLGLGISFGFAQNLHFSPSGLVDGVGALFSGDNPLDASDQEWSQQSADAGQASADRAADHAGDDLVNERGTTGDGPAVHGDPD
jgi:hypothetical protein